MTSLRTDINRILNVYTEDLNWTFHYPVFMNTFCFAFHLSEALKIKKRDKLCRDEFSKRFVRHDWTTPLPEFGYDTDIDIFIGIKGVVEEAEKQGHSIDKYQVEPFTRYNPCEVFIQKNVAGSSEKIDENNTLLFITDVETTAMELKEQWEHTEIPNEISDAFPGVTTEHIEIRNSTKRCFSDLVSTRQKIYVFSAPMSWYFRENKDKYEQVTVSIEPIETSMIFRVNSGVDKRQVIELASATREYYRYIFDTKNRKKLTDNLCGSYSRIAKTIGQQHPFPELAVPKQYIEQEFRTNMTKNSSLPLRYWDILDRHHEPL